MSLRLPLSLQGLAAAGAACLALVSAPGAHAGVVVSNQSYSIANPPDPGIWFNTSPFGFDPGDTIPAQGFYSSASATDNRRSRLPVAEETVFEDAWTLSFDAIAGHRYMVMGVVEVEAANGGDIDFFNTMKITDIDVPSGLLRADVDGRDIADLFGPDAGVVPVPATLWLVLAGGFAAGCLRRRARRD